MTDVRETIDAYLGELGAALRDLHEREREELLAEVRAHFEEAVVDANDPQAEVRAAVLSLGDPVALAERLRAGDAEAAPPERVKRVLGMPYNFKRLTAEEVASRLWNPSDPRILMPRIFGIGWTLNFGAIAVRLGLVRPDDEEPVPFTAVPDGALAAGLAVFTVANLAVVAAAVLIGRPPRPLPVHWGLVEPDRFTTPLSAALQFLGPAIALNVAAGWRWVRGASRTERTLWISFLAIALCILDGFYVNSLGWGFTGRMLFFAGLPVVAGLVVSFGALVLYSRLGLRAEWRRAHVR